MEIQRVLIVCDEIKEENSETVRRIEIEIAEILLRMGSVGACIDWET